MPYWVTDLLRSLFDSLFYEFLVGAAVCLATRWVQKRNEGWFNALFYGFVAFAAVFVLGILLTRRAPQW